MDEKTGRRARLAALMMVSEARETVMSPLSQRASIPREMRELADSRALLLFSALASSRVIPISAHSLRATVVWASEFDSDEFQTRPTVFNSGRMRRAMRNALSTGCIDPNPVM